jgi:hypothetical protein
LSSFQIFGSGSPDQMAVAFHAEDVQWQKHTYLQGEGLYHNSYRFDVPG